MKNDKLDDDLQDALCKIDTAVTDLRAVHWIMQCMADPTEELPDGLYRVDLSHFMAKMVAHQADVIAELTSVAHVKLRERREASR
ncbi:MULTISPECIES: hypothetical protein [Hyphomicrobiales]|jgi:hypothetical protein|uniref:hypothetical protein n=1 Tax=Methylobacterium sp. CCH7-A2 TaxID=1768789 RepID=UPI00083467B9|nr:MULTISPECIES: hypothetical protein [Hyphomicrobiales]